MAEIDDCKTGTMLLDSQQEIQSFRKACKRRITRIGNIILRRDGYFKYLNPR
jgi:hypothetical protein